MNNITEDNFLIIKYLRKDEHYYNKWLSIRNSYIKELDNSAVWKDVAYTPHGYTTHCVGIYRNLSWLISKEDFDVNLNIESIFVLCTAVILHDYIMSKNINMRYTHSKEAKNYILETVNTEQSKLKSFLTVTEAQSVAEIVYGHSDLKYKIDDEIKKIRTIEEMDEECDGKFGKIHIKLLSALLRIADELDICTDRIEGFEYQNQFIPKVEEGKNKIDSMDCWKECELFLLPASGYRSDLTIISLKPNYYLLKSNSNTIDKDIQIIVNRRNKVQEELNYLNDKVFNQSSIIKWKFKKVEINLDSNGMLEQEIKEKLNYALNPINSDDCIDETDKKKR